ncbi:hypothetical protein SLEP1_g9144 [Rubroshorea leprosula]|uniref:DUF4220 domain-containing protein n=1 Tax=Rubroshorea leprosula TaxID=152421 RepID=A0AAV5I9N0_9ROSI|nr:hypothetical protein SLEP1_g9144 [Rubroshorea leprosula]
MSSFSTTLLEVWENWDVRGMVLFSLTLQIVLSVLGRRRKYTLNPFSKIILWFAYLGADWIAIATLAKLSSSHIESPTMNVLRAYWAPLLLFHLGGPDTITAYAFEDNKLWIRHVVILVVKAILVGYIICLSWTFSWLSFLSLPLILAGIIKYVEKVLCLRLNNLQKIEPVISDIFNSQSLSLLTKDQTLEDFAEGNPFVLQDYLLFTMTRPDVNDFLYSHSSTSTSIIMQTYFKEITHINNPIVLPKYLDYIFSGYEKISSGHFEGIEVIDRFVVQLEFIFDVVYTKAALIYTKLGCSLRLTSFVSSFSVLLLFFISIINEPKFHFSRVDLAITGILLTGAIALELYAAWIMLSSDWAILVGAFHHCVLIRKLFKGALSLKCFPSLLCQSKRWSNRIGQFDLLKYCLLYKKKKVNRSSGILQKITIGSDIIEIYHKYRFTKFPPVPCYLKGMENFLAPVTSVFMHNFSRGKKTLSKAGQYDNLSWSFELDFDYSIIIWHLATSVCYYQEAHDVDGKAIISKQVSDYMMYLLARYPALILPERSKSFWLDHTYDMLKDLLFSTTDIRNAASTLVSDSDLQSSESTIEDLQGDVSPTIDIRNVASTLDLNPDTVDNDELESRFDVLNYLFS